MAEKMMHAVQYSGYGGGVAALKHVEVAVPVPKADEVLLKVEAATLNPVDWKIQKGMLRPFLPRKFPTIPGSDVAGEVVQAGSAVKKFKTGDKVVAMVSHTFSSAHFSLGSSDSATTPAVPVSTRHDAGAGTESGLDAGK